METGLWSEELEVEKGYKERSTADRFSLIPPKKKKNDINFSNNYILFSLSLSID